MAKDAPFLNDTYKKIPREFEDLQAIMEQIEGMSTAIKGLQDKLANKIAKDYNLAGLLTQRTDIGKRIFKLMSESAKIEKVIKMTSSYGLAIREVFEQSTVFSPKDLKMKEAHEAELKQIMERAETVYGNLKSAEILLFKLAESHIKSAIVESADEITELVSMLEQVVSGIGEMESEMENLYNQII